MKDYKFKNLPHRVGELAIRTRGTEVAAGYKPDLTITDRSGRLVFIVECEQKTDRKAFLGALVKAEKFAEECAADPTLIIVMQPYDNTTVDQIANHLRPYASWLGGMRPQGLNLADVLIISDDEYDASINNDEILGSDDFRSRARAIMR